MNGETLRWEWKAGRVPSKSIAAEIVSIEKASTGFLGARNSPSIADSLPDPIIVTFKSRNADKHYTLKMPKIEIGQFKQGDEVALDLVDPNICIAVRSPQAVTTK